MNRPAPADVAEQPSAAGAGAVDTGAGAVDSGSGGVLAATAGGEGAPPVVVDRLLRVLGAVLALAGALVAAMLSMLLIPLRVGALGPLSGGLLADASSLAAVRLPVAIVVAVGGNLFLIWFARQATGVRWGALLPGLGWFAMVVIALYTTVEGDRLLLPDDWVATFTLFGGTLVIVIGTVLAITPPRRR